MITNEQKNINILNRFESKENCGDSTKYTVHFKDNSKCIMVEHGNKSIEKINKMLIDIFGNKFDYAEM